MQNLNFFHEVSQEPEPLRGPCDTEIQMGVGSRNRGDDDFFGLRMKGNIF